MRVERFPSDHRASSDMTSFTAKIRITIGSNEACLLKNSSGHVLIKPFHSSIVSLSILRPTFILWLTHIERLMPAEGHEKHVAEWFFLTARILSYGRARAFPLL